MNLVKNKFVNEIINKYQKIWSLQYINSLTGWDTETFMSSSGILARSKVLSTMSGLLHDQYLDAGLYTLLQKAGDEPTLNDYEKKIIHNIKKQIDIYNKLPKKFVEEFTDLIAGASTIWAESKRNNDLQTFLPLLNRIFEKSREKADLLGYDEEPYEALFKEFEDDFSVKELNEYFFDLKTFLSKIDIKNISKKHITRTKNVIYDIDAMKKINSKLLNFLGASSDSFRLDTSSHAFSTFMSLNDIRLTTHYNITGFASSFLSTVHEFGHGLFASGADKELEFTPLWPDTSYALHESQSRFWENMIARNKNFLNVFIDDFRSLSPEFKDLTVDDIYADLNRIRPNSIRTQADEITYHYHIIIRYEIEKALLNKEINVNDVNELWNSKYKEYLGIVPINYSEGVLQDIHWSLGSIGYFPTYSLGSVLSGTWLEMVEKELLLENKTILTIEDINKLKLWLKSNIHRYADTYNLKQIAIKVSGKSFSPLPWEKYIKRKFKIDFDN